MNNEYKEEFFERHIGPSEEEEQEMLNLIGVNSLEELIDEVIPNDIKMHKELEKIGLSLTEQELLNELKEISKKNKVFKSYIGMGYYPTVVPSVIKRNILENPGWYTQYTPYQAEISQGRLEALINFQTMVIDLTKLPIANSSLLDEGTAAAEAMLMFYYSRKNTDANKFLVSKDCFPQTIDVLKSRAIPKSIELIITDHKSFELTEDVFGLFVQYPACDGEIFNYSNLFEQAEKKGIYKAVAADLLSLTLLTPPGEFGADVCVGNTQRFGVPMGYGGPHAAYLSAKEEFKRKIPGRIIGYSVDRRGNNALRMALQTREQHIRRDKATSNICTAQVLLAVMAGMYAVYHGPKRIKLIAERISKLAVLLETELDKLGIKQLNENFFDTLKLQVPFSSPEIYSQIEKTAIERKLNFRYLGNNLIGISLSEVDGLEDIKNIVNVFSSALKKEYTSNFNEKTFANLNPKLPQDLIRKSEYLTHPVFNSYHSETKMLRYIKSLEKKDLSLIHSMTPLGSCTMKLNATSELLPFSWEEFANIHPFVPTEQAEGYQIIFDKLKNYLCEITGFEDVSLQPNSGAQGEFAGLSVIRAYHCSNGEDKRNIVLIPSSAHGTNPASAVMAGMKVVVVNCDSYGNIDINDLKTKAEDNKEFLAALMVTYPSTHGVFEKSIREICSIVHQNGGQVYMDGANMNAQVGLTSPAIIGADVCHLNLHKTFAIPHGGGGPGVGPIAVAKHLVNFLPNHSVIKIRKDEGINAVSSAPWGSASILTISYAYIRLMGAKGLKKASMIAILNANYLKAKLSPYYKVVYSGENGRVAHELIFDAREFKASANIEVEDIAKRLMDYGFHAPTVSFPVHGTLMVEPTESEAKDELDRFCEAMIKIRDEISDIENGKVDIKDNLLKNSPHTAFDLVMDNWQHSYSKENAVFPLDWVKANKFWPAVNRIDGAYGDRNLLCSCLPVSEYITD